MPACLKTVQLADGNTVLALDTAATDLTACVYVVESGADIGSSILHMSAQDGWTLSAGLISVWLAAWGIRQIIEVIKGSSE